MPTIVEALTQAGQDLRDAVAAVLGLRSDMQVLKDSTTNQATTIVNNFINRPPVVIVYCDPINGDDTKDGSTIAKAKKSLDAIVDAAGSNPTEIRLLNNGIFKKRTTTNVPIYMIGIQPANNEAGYIVYRRRVGFLGTAENSPSPVTGSFCAGIFFQGPILRTTAIDWDLPDVPVGLDYRSHLTSTINLAVSSDALTLTVASANAGTLFGAFNARLTATMALTLGTGAAGHVFQGVAANQNPNLTYPYTSSITSA